MLGIGVGAAVFDVANAIAIQADGKIIVAGYTGTNSTYDFALARYNTDGSLDNEFAPSLNGAVDAFATQPDGKVVAVRCEMRSANTLRRSGWTPDLFPEGQQITITGSPDRDDPYSGYVSTVIFDDGSSLDRYGQITAPAEIGQGERPQRLASGEPNISGDWAQEQVVMTDPRGQIGTLVPLSQVEEIRAAGDLAARGSIPGARNTEQAAAQVAAASGGGTGAGRATFAWSPAACTSSDRAPTVPSSTVRSSTVRSPITRSPLTRSPRTRSTDIESIFVERAAPVNRRRLRLTPRSGRRRR